MTPVSPRRVPLTTLLDALGDRAHLRADPAFDPDDLTITGVAYDSRQVEPGALFCCVPGQHVDGHLFAAAAVETGAAAVLVEHDLHLPIPQIEVADARRAMATVATAFWGDPSASLEVVGVTGTNGKTTVTNMLAAILQADGRATGVIGTLSGTRTTPEAPDLQAHLAACVDEGIRSVAMEVSSHALALHRVDGTHFRAAVFTNLSRDHLDFHPSMEAYFQAKAKLFDADRTELAVVNLDDPRGRLLRDAAVVPTVGYRLDDVAIDRLDASGTTFRWRGTSMHVALAGRHNLSNALAAATTAAELGVGIDAVAAGLAGVSTLPGRFEPVSAGQDFEVVVDYAHSPDALEHVLSAARELVGSDRRVLVVFGCGGDRDPSKRAPMGEVASRLADVVVLTSDNPRGEPPLRIIDQIRSGVVSGTELVVEPDRREALARSLARAHTGDIVVVAGKGHETTQQIGDAELPFDDHIVVAELLGAHPVTGSAENS